jgi:hypothetical protein
MPMYRRRGRGVMDKHLQRRCWDRLHTLQVGGVVPKWTPTASLIPAQGNALGNERQNSIAGRRPASYLRQESGGLQRPLWRRLLRGQASTRLASPIRRDANHRYEAGRWPAIDLRGPFPRALPWAGMRDAFGVVLTGAGRNVQTPAARSENAPNSLLDSRTRGLIHCAD